VQNLHIRSFCIRPNLLRIQFEHIHLVRLNINYTIGIVQEGGSLWEYRLVAFFCFSCHIVAKITFKKKGLF
jgi:hypothetical protein